MKLTGLLALCSALSLTGIYFFRLYTKRIKLLKALSDFFYLFADYAFLSESDITDCIRKVMMHKELSFLHFPFYFSGNFCFGCNIRDLWRDSLNSDKELYVLDKASKELLLSFQECFGKNPLCVFSEKCKSYGSRFLSLFEEEQAMWEKNRTLFLSSGILAAAAVFFIMV